MSAQRGAQSVPAPYAKHSHSDPVLRRAQRRRASSGSQARRTKSGTAILYPGGRVLPKKLVTFRRHSANVPHSIFGRRYFRLTVVEIERRHDLETETGVF